MKRLFLLAFLATEAFGQSFQLGPEQLASEPVLASGVAASSVAAGSNGDSFLVAWQPSRQQSIAIQQIDRAGNRATSFATPLVTGPTIRSLGNVVSNGRDYAVAFAGGHSIWISIVSATTGERSLRELVSSPAIDSKTAKPRVASNGRGYLLAYIEGSRLMAIRLDDLGAPLGDPLQLAALARDVSIASSGLDYLVGATARDCQTTACPVRLFAVPVSAAGAVSAAVTLAANLYLDNQLLIPDGRSYVAVWHETPAIYSMPVAENGQPGTRISIATNATPIAAAPGLLVITGGGLQAIRLGPGGIPRDPVPVALPGLAGASAATVASAGETFYLAAAAPRLSGTILPPSLATGWRDVAQGAVSQRLPAIVPLGGLYAVAWQEDQVRVGRLSGGKYLDGSGIVVNDSPFPGVLTAASDGERALLVYTETWGDGYDAFARIFTSGGGLGPRIRLASASIFGDPFLVEDAVWSGRQFVVIVSRTSHIGLIPVDEAGQPQEERTIEGFSARAAPMRDGVAVAADQENGLTLQYFGSDLSPRSSGARVVDGRTNILDMASDGDDRVMILWRPAGTEADQRLRTAVFDGAGRMVRGPEPLPVIAQSARVGWSGLTFVVTVDGDAARFSRDGLLIPSIQGKALGPLFPAAIPPWSMIVERGIVAYLRPLAEYGLGEADHVMTRAIIEDTRRQRTRR